MNCAKNIAATDFSQAFWTAPETERLLAPFARVALGVSGGVDSMALLWLLTVPARPGWAPEPVAVHVNHRLRGAESDADEALVRAFAAERGAAFRVRRLDAARLTAQGVNLEEAARDGRRRALREAARRAGCDAVVLAHHADDLAETLLMRLLRGSGLTGLRGFDAASEMEGVPLLRPLIAHRRDDLLALARGAGIPWREDATNRDLARMRNRLRLRILPALEKWTDHPPAARMLARTARRLGREAEALTATVEALYRTHGIKRAHPRRVGLCAAAFEGPTAPLAPYLMRRLFQDAAGDGRPPPEERLAELEAFARDARSGALLQSAGNVVAWRAPDGAVWLWRKPRRKVAREEILKAFREP